MGRKLKNQELQRLSVMEFKRAPKTPLTIVLDNIRSLHNIGSVFRTADAFLLEKIYLCGITAVPPNKDIRKTALGATETVTWAFHKDTAQLVANLKRDGYTVLAIEQAENSKMLHNYEIAAGKKYALIFGNEVKGVGQEVIDLSDDVLEIPQFGTKHSINVSVSVGMVVWQFWSNLKPTLSDHLI